MCQQCFNTVSFILAHEHCKIHHTFSIFANFKKVASIMVVDGFYNGAGEFFFSIKICVKSGFIFILILKAFGPVKVLLCPSYFSVHNN